MLILDQLVGGTEMPIHTGILLFRFDLHNHNEYLIILIAFEYSYAVYFIIFIRLIIWMMRCRYLQPTYLCNIQKNDFLV